jgi:hypothetical protein
LIKRASLIFKPAGAGTGRAHGEKPRALFALQARFARPKAAFFHAQF